MNKEFDPRTIKPLATRILVHVDKVEERTKGGIYLQDTTKQQHAEDKGTIIKMGAGACFNAPESEKFKIGTRVVFGRYAGGELNYVHEGETYRLLNDVDVAGIIEE